MSMRGSEVIAKLENIIPMYLAEQWDNCGWQFGNPGNEITGIIVCLDVSTDVIKTAHEHECNLIISHHPLFFKGMKSLVPNTFEGKIALELAKNNVGLYSFHTNLDVMDGGINDFLAQIFDLNDLLIMEITGNVPCYKLHVNVPQERAEMVQKELIGAGFDLNNSREINRFQETFDLNNLMVSESKIVNNSIISEGMITIEFIVLEDQIIIALGLLERFHINMKINHDSIRIQKGKKIFGIGRVGNLTKNITIREFAACVTEKLGIDACTIYGDSEKLVKRVAVCGGSGGDLIDAALKHSADVYITGDIKYHQALNAVNANLNILDVGHYESENIFMRRFADIVIEAIPSLAGKIIMHTQGSMDKSVIFFNNI